MRRVSTWFSWKVAAATVMVAGCGLDPVSLSDEELTLEFEESDKGRALIEALTLRGCPVTDAWEITRDESAPTLVGLARHSECPASAASPGLVRASYLYGGIHSDGRVGGAFAMFFEQEEIESPDGSTLEDVRLVYYVDENGALQEIGMDDFLAQIREAFPWVGTASGPLTDDVGASRESLCTTATERALLFGFAEAGCSGFGSCGECRSIVTVAANELRRDHNQTVWAAIAPHVGTVAETSESGTGLTGFLAATAPGCSSVPPGPVQAECEVYLNYARAMAAHITWAQDNRDYPAGSWQWHVCNAHFGTSCGTNCQKGWIDSPGCGTLGGLSTGNDCILVDDGDGMDGNGGTPCCEMLDPAFCQAGF